MKTQTPLSYANGSGKESKLAAYFLSLLLVGSLGLVAWLPSGCATYSGIASQQDDAYPRGEIAMALAQTGFEIYANRQLEKNSEYVEILERISAGIDTLFAENAEVTPERIKAFTGRLAEEFKIKPIDERDLGNALLAVHNVYRAYHGDGPILALSPGAQKVLTEIRACIDRVCEMQRLYNVNSEIL